MKTIAVFFSAPGYADYPFDDDYYVQAYHELAHLLQKKGARFVIVRGQDSYMGGNRFAHCWRFDGTTFKYEEAPVEVDLIYDKGYFKHDEGATLLNDPVMNDICTDKFKTYELFPRICPRTAVVHDEAEKNELIKEFNDIVVGKPLDNEGGKGVIIDRPDIVRESIKSYPYLLQEFLDTSAGIPGIIDAMHDLRMVIVNGEIAVSYVRSPAAGKKVSNVAQGGTQTEVPVREIPKEARALAKAVDDVFASYPRRVYSVDCARDANGTWKLIELNSKPGITRAYEGPDHVRFLDLLTDALLS